MVRPWAVMLSVVIMVRFSCGCPISSRVVKMGTASLQPWQSAANSALEAENMTYLIIENNVRMALLLNSLSL